MTTRDANGSGAEPPVTSPSEPTAARPRRAGATEEERDPGGWPPALFEPIQQALDRGSRRGGVAVRDTFGNPTRAMTARQFVTFWNECRVKAMATVGRNGQPHLAPVHADFVEGILRSSIYENARRLDDLRHNPVVAFTTWGPNGAAAIVRGRARIVPGSLRDTRPGATGRPRRTWLLEIDLDEIHALAQRPPAPPLAPDTEPSSK